MNIPKSDRSLIKLSFNQQIKTTNDMKNSMNTETWTFIFVTISLMLYLYIGWRSRVQDSKCSTIFGDI
ncbi:MAG: hypothetical protein F6K39_23095 [Okeania sp. SIO3B3]|nr:hypothetical protein [Okeania sp. SIO3B3]